MLDHLKFYESFSIEPLHEGNLFHNPRNRRLSQPSFLKIDLVIHTYFEHKTALKDLSGNFQLHILHLNLIQIKFIRLSRLENII